MLKEACRENHEWYLHLYWFASLMEKSTSAKPQLNQLFRGSNPGTRRFWDQWFGYWWLEPEWYRRMSGKPINASPRYIVAVVWNNKWIRRFGLLKPALCKHGAGAVPLCLPPFCGKIHPPCMSSEWRDHLSASVTCDSDRPVHLYPASSLPRSPPPYWRTMRRLSRANVCRPSEESDNSCSSYGS